MRRFSLVCAAAAMAALSVSAPDAQAPSPGNASAKAPAASVALTIDSIMRGPDLVGYPPSGLRWSGDSQRLYFDWRKPGDEESSTYVVSREGGEPRKLSDADAKHAPPTGGRWDAAHKRLLVSDGGDIAIFATATGTRRQITKTSGAEGNPRWARNDTHVTYVSGGNLFIMAVDNLGPLVTQLTDVSPRRADPRLTDSQKFIKDEEQKLIEYTKLQADRRKKREEKAKAERIPTFEISPQQSSADLMLSPDETHVFIVVGERPAGAKNTIVPSYVTESGYVEDIPARTNVGDTQDRRLLAVLNLKTGKSVWADGSFAPPIAEPPTPAPPAVAAGQEATGDTPRPGRRAERDIRWSMPTVSHDGKLVVASARSADNKDRWFVTLDPTTGKTKVIDTLHDDAWIREAGFGGSGVEFLPDARRVWFLSERDGWMHVYTLDVSADAARPRQLTSGRWEVAAAEVGRDGKKFYLTTTENHPGERHLYTVSTEGGARTQITKTTGSNEATVSPDESMLGLVYSYSTKPPEVFLMPNRPGAQATQVTTTPTPEWRAFNWIDPKVITYQARDGVEVYARLFTPEMIGARRDASRPAVVFVHGAGYLQNAHKYWSTYFREYMFH
ncbi:MAG: DPP IV N-terminal domain-containing protein, partial [Vicinamibacterales bacterium]